MSCILVLLNVSKAEEKERRLASTIESMQASHILQNTTLRSRFGQSVSVTNKSETIAYFANFATPVLNPPRLIDFCRQTKRNWRNYLKQPSKRSGFLGPKQTMRPRNKWCSTRADGVAWSVKAKSQPDFFFRFHVKLLKLTCLLSQCSRALAQGLGKWSMVFVF